jgi:hypothetical protein
MSFFLLFVSRGIIIKYRRPGQGQASGRLLSVAHTKRKKDTTIKEKTVVGSHVRSILSPLSFFSFDIIFASSIGYLYMYICENIK